MNSQNETRTKDTRELEHEARQLSTASSTVLVSIPVDAVPLLTELARAEWDRRQRADRAHRIRIARGPNRREDTSGETP